MFNSIAVKYDLLNHILSVHIDKLWRKKLIRLIAATQQNKTSINILDLATGTGDLAIAASSITNATITGLDIAKEMIKIAENKINALNKSSQIKFQVADAEAIPFSDNTFDIVMVSFGVRNYSNLQKGLSESLRVLKPKGYLFVMEFSTPTYFPVKQFYLLYFKYIMPLIGRLVSKNKNAYQYLTNSVLAFPTRKAFEQELIQVGFNNTKTISLSLGIAQIYQSQKSN